MLTSLLYFFCLAPSEQTNAKESKVKYTNGFQAKLITHDYNILMIWRGRLLETGRLLGVLIQIQALRGWGFDGGGAFIGLLTVVSTFGLDYSLTDIIGDNSIVIMFFSTH